MIKRASNLVKLKNSDRLINIKEFVKAYIWLGKG